MARPFVVGFDGSEASRLALDFAAERAAALKRTLVLVNVVPASVKNLAFSELLLPGIDLSSVVKPGKFRDVAQQRLDEVAEEARKRGVEVQAMVRAGDSADELIAAARELDAEQIVLGFMSYEHKLPYGIGTVAEKVMRNAGCTVTVVRPHGKPAKGSR
jgi:nucleotide-binding universal stress UspA family protein